MDEFLTLRLRLVKFKVKTVEKKIRIVMTLPAWRPHQKPIKLPLAAHLPP